MAPTRIPTADEPFVRVRADGTRWNVWFEDGAPFYVVQLRADGVPTLGQHVALCNPRGSYARAAARAADFIAGLAA